MTTRRAATPPAPVAFVGAGPGDPGLLTVRALQALADADLVVVDRPEHRVLLRELAGLPIAPPPDLEVLDAALGADGAPLAAAQRAKLLVARARQGARVVRLVTGDPGLLGGLGEEALACAKAGVPVEVIPGVPAATAVPAYAGIPLTAGQVRSVHVLSLGDGEPDWSAHARSDVTLVVLAEAARVVTAAEGLVAAGRAGATPVAVTVDGTSTAQRTVVTTLAQLAAAVRAAELDGPVLAVVGDVVKHREALSWFETKPLFGWRVLVPRTKEQAGALSAQLRGYGAVPEEVPTISVEAPRNPQQMEKAIRGLVEGRYEWIAFTSVNALRAVREKFSDYGLDARAFSGLKVAAVGERTAEALRSWGIVPDLVPSGEQSARGLLDDWPPFDEVLDPINRVFLPRADIATETLVAGLQELGWEVDDVTAYRTVRAAPPAADVREAIKTGRFDAVVFTSSSTVRNLVGIAGKPHAATVVACIGPQTAKTAEEHGLRVDVLAPTPSVEAVVAALAEFGAARRAALIEAGEPVTRPSEKRRAAGRRKA